LVRRLGSKIGGSTDSTTQEGWDSASDIVPRQNDWDVDRWEHEDGVYYPTPTPDGSQKSF